MVFFFQEAVANSEHIKFRPHEAAKGVFWGSGNGLTAYV
jgi:hypothetical protein